MKAETPPDPRAAGIRSLRAYMPIPRADDEAKAERRLIHRLDLREQVRP
jgi:hypothetical protein